MDVEDYDLEKTPIATGAQGSVYFGVRRSDNSPVAVKIAGAGKGAIQALVREVELLRLINETGIGGVVPCLDLLVIDDHPALVMPRYPEHLGSWLHRMIGSGGPTTLDEILAKIAQLAYVLGRIHQTEFETGTVVHRDVKPENVFLDHIGRPFLGDFGGAMAIDGLKAVELTLFGTPMWAPLDQILPGKAIPDPTWDTYALCVILYAALTGARPAYQADPRELLTDRGVALWMAARQAIEAPKAERHKWQRKFARMRMGTSAADLVDLTGRAALVPGDEEAIRKGVARLAGLANIRPSRSKRINQQLWSVLLRGLSPTSHPSPPNRYRDGIELGDVLEQIRSGVRAHSEATPQPVFRRLLSTLVGEAEVELDEPPSTSLKVPSAARTVAGLAIILGLFGIAITLARGPIMDLARPFIPIPEHAEIPMGTAELGDGKSEEVPAFRIETTEVTVAQYKACVAAGICNEVYQRVDDAFPVIGLRLEDASAYCEWKGGRLPSEAEWLRAAGPGPMPWGDGPATCNRAVALGCANDVQPVGGRPAGASLYGVQDLAGNAWEWVAGSVVMGGGAISPASELGQRVRLPIKEGDPHPLGGMRCRFDI